MSSLRDKSLAYGAQLYAAGLLIILLPAYLSQLGAEQFGLMMVFFVAQGWLQIADLGFPLALSREVAVARREQRLTEVGPLLASLQLPALLGMVLVSSAVLAVCYWMAGPGIERIFPDLRMASLAMLAGALALSLRWAAELYRAALAGAEQFSQLAVLNIASVTARLGGGLIALRCAGGDISVWLLCQAIFFLVEILALILLCRRRLEFRFSGGLDTSFTAVRTLWPIAMQISAASAIWISITQLDKLILSQALSLSEYGAIAIAAAIPAGLLTLAVPLLQLSYPALIRLHHRESRREQTHLYLMLTEGACCLLFPTALVCMAFSQELLTVWFAGRLNATTLGAVTLVPLYAAGASFLALSAMPYGLLNAAGELRSHVVASLALAVCMAAALIIGALHAGAKGAITLWCGSAALFFLIWPQIVHRSYLDGSWWPWARTIAFFALPLGVVAFTLKYLLPNPTSLFARMGELAGAWMVLQGIAVCMLWFRHRQRMATSN
ncbi:MULTISPECIES: lipopolysaccharide biosynthesis protein [unclassified Variovorax]|uniref:lipopolysaccharide biosynthesis protein n=1 Tax=unclassified Variovorax TaxID=663243 RepID=UPI00076C7FFC|nr:MULTISPECIES: lipopolysaccharide biosynthesis protein [unclassified Variovorax]KWT85755.1 putative polysaccharide biosynthesis protein [Variovorax sp. WDL1]PNG58384.1 hypothetical protein CHC07_00108 [Variovorax sp. B4]PNG61826.1 hypothetical protein CHC06_01728 [Variovorax sp. B2]VTV12111.1 Polysaccharide biosynthesis protein [Variovorax sp. WDL1]